LRFGRILWGSKIWSDIWRNCFLWKNSNLRVVSRVIRLMQWSFELWEKFDGFFCALVMFFWVTKLYFKLQYLLRKWRLLDLLKPWLNSQIRVLLLIIILSHFSKHLLTFYQKIKDIKVKEKYYPINSIYQSQNKIYMNQSHVNSFITHC